MAAEAPGEGGEEAEGGAGRGKTDGEEDCDGGDKESGGRLSTSATTLAEPETWRISVQNSEMYER